MLNKMDIGYSSLTDRVFMGKSQAVKGAKEGVREFTGEKIDITSKFLFIVDQFFEMGTSRIIRGGKKESLFMHIENTNEAKQKLIKDLQKDLEKQE